MKKIIVSCLLMGFVFLSAHSQGISVNDYINTYRDLAVQEMKRTGIPASITLAQGILETEHGNSDLVKKSNNHFGIKCKSSWTGPSVSHDDDASGECFRKYPSAEDSYKDHSNFLKGSSRYSFLFDLDPNDYKGWAYGLKKAGYATNPKYPNILIKHIEEYQLNQYDAADYVPGNLPDNMSVKNRSTIQEETPEVRKVDSEIPLQQSNQLSSSIKSGKSLFNGLKAFYAVKNTSLLAIATAYEIPLSQLLEFNDLETDGLLKQDQWIFLEKKKKLGNRDFHEAAQGERYYDIAQTNAIQLSYLLQYNNLEKDQVLRKGTKVRLRPANKLKSSS